MTNLLKALLCGTTPFAFSLAAMEAQEAPAPARPRIGLVLNGGGALGLAHIGALRWLEEHRIPVDVAAVCSTTCLSM
jgi:NTE family protein